READEEFDAIVSDLTPPNGGQVPRLLEVALEQSTDRGVHYSVLEETTRLPGPRIRELMSLIGLPPVDATFRMRPGTDSPKKRGYRRGDLDRVAAEIARGDVQVPTEVRDALYRTGGVPAGTLPPSQAWDAPGTSQERPSIVPG